MASPGSSANSSYQLCTQTHGARRRRTPLPDSELDSLPFHIDIEPATGRPPLERRHSDHNLHFDLDLDTMPREPESRFCWQYFFLKGCAVAYVVVLIWIFSPLVSLIIYGTPDLHPNTPAWILNHKHDPQYFSSFTGHDECGIDLTHLYNVPNPRASNSDLNICNSRRETLDAMSNGGRIGFDAPFHSQGCDYRWFTPKEICKVLGRFENVIFVGDASLHRIYAGLNILLSKDLATGALQHQEMTTEEVAYCRCQDQFILPHCVAKWVGSRSVMAEKGNGAKKQASSSCKDGMNIHFLSYDTSHMSSMLTHTLTSLMPTNKKKAYKPIPVVHSLTYGTNPPLSSSDARRALSTIVTVADIAERKTPILMIGPSAPGSQVSEQDRPSRLNANDFSHQMHKEARDKDVEWLGMWNATIQVSGGAASFGEEVAITQAMMVVNWLARL